MGQAEKSEETSDADLIAQMAAGNARALEPLYRRHWSMVQATVRRYGPRMSTEEIEDVCQEVFLVVYRSAGKYQEQGKFRSWLCGIAVRKARKERYRAWMRLKVRNEIQDDSPPTRADSPLPDQMDSRRALGVALRSLTEQQRETLMMHTVEGMSAEEIATTLGIRPNTVWTRINRARATMLKALQGRRPKGGQS